MEFWDVLRAFTLLLSTINAIVAVSEENMTALSASLFVIFMIFISEPGLEIQ